MPVHHDFRVEPPVEAVEHVAYRIFRHTHRRLHRHPGAVRAHDDLVEGEEGMGGARRRRLRLEHVEPGPADPPCLERGDERVLSHHAAPRGC